MSGAKTEGVYLSRTTVAKPARPTWSAEEKAEAVDAIFEAMAEGRTLEQAVRDLARPCTAGAMRRWIAEDEGWTQRYQRAKRLLAQALAEEAIQIARDSTSSTTAVDRVLIDTLKWAAAKANPAEYGERQTVEHQGAQELAIRIVEEEAPVRNADAMRNGTTVTAVQNATMAQIRAVETAVLSATTTSGSAGGGRLKA